MRQHLSKVSFVVHLVVPDVTQPCLARQIPQVEQTNWTLLPPEARQDTLSPHCIESSHLPGSWCTGQIFNKSNVGKCFFLQSDIFKYCDLNEYITYHNDFSLSLSHL